MKALVLKFYGLPGALILAALTVIAWGGPWLIEGMTLERLAGTQTLIDQLWWPATAVRCLAYLGLAVRIDRMAMQRHTRHPARYVIGVFLALAASDGLLAQFPYWLLRG